MNGIGAGTGTGGGALVVVGIRGVTAVVTGGRGCMIRGGGVVCGWNVHDGRGCGRVGCSRRGSG